MSSKAWETTGVDVSRDRIVELAATQGHDLAHLPGASFSQVVRVPEEIQQSASAQAAAAVHGITDEEIALGTTCSLHALQMNILQLSPDRRNSTELLTLTYHH